LSKHLERTLFFALLLLQLVPAWWFTYFPSQDGPAHLENAAILRDFGRPDRAFLHTFYTLNTRPEPNWLSHLVLAGLMLVFPPLVAEKVLLSAYLILLPLAVRYAARALRPDAGFLGILAMPFAYNVFLHKGFYNFCFSLVVFFVVLGYWLRHRGAFTPKRTVIFLLLVLLLYFCHIVSVVAAGLVIGSLTAWRLVADLAAARRAGRLSPAVWGACLRAQVLPPLFAFLPAAILCGLFLLRQAGGDAHSGALATGGASPPVFTLAGLVVGLIEVESLISYQIAEGMLALALGAGLLLVAVWLLAKKVRSRRLLAGDELLLGVAVLALVYFLIPEGAGHDSSPLARVAEMARHESLTLRFGLYPFLALLLWFAAQPFGLRARVVLQAGAAALTLLFVALNFSNYQRLQPYLEEYCSCRPWIERQATVLPICFAQAGRAEDGRPLCLRVGPFANAAGYLAADAELIDLPNYEARTGYFPILFRPEVNPYRYLGSRPGNGLLEDPPRVDIAGYTAQTGQSIDYVLLYGLRPGQPTGSPERLILQQLEAGYECVYQSPQHGLVQLYRRKDDPAQQRAQAAP
jgi:hypothetical protein